MLFLLPGDSAGPPLRRKASIDKLCVDRLLGVWGLCGTWKQGVAHHEVYGNLAVSASQPMTSQKKLPLSEDVRTDGDNDIDEPAQGGALPRLSHLCLVQLQSLPCFEKSHEPIWTQVHIPVTL